MPYDSPMKKKGSSCMQMKDPKGKPSGLMMEGSVNHMSMLYQEETKKVEEAKAKKLDKKQEIKEKKDLLTEMPVDDKASAMEMSPYKMGHEDSPNKMSPLNDNHDIDPKTGKRVVQPFVDPGAPEGFESSMGERYDEGMASRRFMGAQKQAQNALNIARKQLKGTDVINQRVKGQGSSTMVGPSASQVITGYSTDPTGKVTFNRENVQAKLDELDKLAVRNPVKARSIISRNISGAPLGDFRSKFMRDVNPFND